MSMKVTFTLDDDLFQVPVVKVLQQTQAYRDLVTRLLTEYHNSKMFHTKNPELVKLHRTLRALEQHHKDCLAAAGQSHHRG